MLKAGADKVSLNTAAVNNPALIGQGATQFGNQCIVVAIDAKRVQSHPAGTDRPRAADASLALDDASQWEVYTRGGRTPTGLDAVKWAVRAVELGSGEILLTSMDEDGQKGGYDLGLTQSRVASNSRSCDCQRRRRKSGASLRRPRRWSSRRRAGSQHIPLWRILHWRSQELSY